jgi:hypothetical protein
MKPQDLPKEPAQPLAHALRRLGAELQAREPPPWASLQARLAQAAPARTTPWWRPRWPVGLAMASVAVMAVMLAVFTGQQPKPDAGEFVAVANAEGWLRLSGEGGQAWLVQSEMPQSRLASYGLPFDPGRAAQPVRTELLMRASGEVLALRILD